MSAARGELCSATFLRVIVEVSAQATNTARRILLLREDHRRIITENFGRTTANGHRLLEYLYEHPIISVNEVQDLIGMTYPAANKLVRRMVDNHILHEFTGQARNRGFMYRSYIGLFYGTESEAGT